MVAVLLLSVAGIGALYQVIGNWYDERGFHPEGRLVQAGAVRLHINCSGQGQPTVVLDTGFAVPAITWAMVQPDVAAFARVCSYDRAGYGWSDEGPAPRTSQQIATELHALLAAAGERGPYVLVGHSFGGFNLRVFTSLYPAEAAGLVLVDAADEDEDERLAELHDLLPDSVKQQQARRDALSTRVNRVWRPIRLRLGVRRLEMATGWGLDADDPDRKLPNAVRREIFYLQRQDKSQRAAASESESYNTSTQQARSAGTLGDRPLIVLTAGRPYEADRLLPAAFAQRRDDVWIKELQARQARLSTRGKQIVVGDSSHVIPYERPDAVIAAIREIWTASCTSCPRPGAAFVVSAPATTNHERPTTN